MISPPAYEINKTLPTATVSTRIPLTERAVVVALAELEGVTISKMVRALLVPAATRALAARANGAAK